MDTNTHMLARGYIHINKSINTVLYCVLGADREAQWKNILLAHAGLWGLFSYKKQNKAKQKNPTAIVSHYLHYRPLDLPPPPPKVVCSEINSNHKMLEEDEAKQEGEVEKEGGTIIHRSFPYHWHKVLPSALCLWNGGVWLPAGPYAPWITVWPPTPSSLLCCKTETWYMFINAKLKKKKRFPVKTNMFITRWQSAGHFIFLSRELAKCFLSRNFFFSLMRKQNKIGNTEERHGARFQCHCVSKNNNIWKPLRKWP